MDGSDGNDANLLLGHFASKTGIQVLQKVERNEKAYIESPWFVFAYSATMSGCGPEFAMLSSLKYTVMGERICVMAPYDCIESLMQSEMTAKNESTDLITPHMVCDFFSKSDAALAGKMDQYAVRAKLSPGSLLYVPWGWVVCERTINGNCTAGFRWLMVDDNFTEPIVTLAHRVLPSQGSKAKPNTSIAFLQRVCTIVNDLPKDQKAALPPSAFQQLSDVLKVKKEEVKTETGSSSSSARPSQQNLQQPQSKAAAADVKAEAKAAATVAEAAAQAIKKREQEKKSAADSSKKRPKTD